MDRGAWWATVHGAAKNWTRLKQLSWHARRVCQSLCCGSWDKEGASGVSTVFLCGAVTEGGSWLQQECRPGTCPDWDERARFWSR